MDIDHINWYPGHMKKTKDLIKENLKIVDLVLEIVDARIPISSRNPDLEKLAGNKKIILVLNKADLIEEEELNKWKSYFQKNKRIESVIAVSAETGYNIKKLFDAMEKSSKEKKEKYKKKGFRNVVTRILIAGIPNVGKSKIINRLAGRKAAGVGNVPGFTRGKQWIKLKQGFEMLDTPGVLWPKFDDNKVGIKLAITGAIKDNILESDQVADKFLSILREKGIINLIINKYELCESLENFEIIENIAEKMGMYQKNKKLDIENASMRILRDYRSMKLGKFGID